MVFRIYIYMWSPTSLWWLYLEAREFWILNIIKKKKTKQPCIFRGGKKKVYNNSFNLTEDIYCTIPKEQDKLLRASADCLFIWHISMKGGFLPSGAWPLLCRILLLRFSKLLFQIQYSEIHSNLNCGIRKVIITLSITCWYIWPSHESCPWDQHLHYNRT